ncbi:MAG: hypothetical protein A2268_06965 [Candidatus Raymondbacteria bacterium RifOxyA12_full_50_37]|uniref:Uncharacterized protein n=1 Tax=Candidatus Raymondbacteria bacterium RIFOXYD12_FULL_49_13 TaxID=1817890 RepID=A0A1F7FE77_UNCRA|nr:MAG: hypothetical protein A2268_06965 [Candidatus Raymondbacteria bacterium RifOxyA12_full_50_37]OGJ97525.1 MAG: hypothetical protein A2453_01880 [Candidatus Raymondbacteria bacterium RIFOXYC2_FULL_50_21]OGK00171.1 MAG: hypothetical protein A2350_16420 [Candidatus Raymondbacteria bacterium RifOxyB12_full_50_8]OGK05000.1 MAG: hypothetical protein A2519_09990 [Candidatus Raymondbacteria bacterium RIFOXYD12_FULL_49_13]OGK06802.1 MAG: hypothetical protein A2487_12215 [Candidatus Raymondbacteria 
MRAFAGPDIIRSARRPASFQRRGRLTFVWCFVAREFEEPLREGKQMKTVPWAVYAPTRRKAKRPQMRIAKATQQKGLL